MQASEIQYLVTQVIKIATDAGEAILEIYNSSDFGIESKSDESPITKADKNANEIICRGLAHISPSIPIVSEENSVMLYADRKDEPFLWMVDPLDGTKEFIKRNGEFTVNIALIHNQKPIAGIVYVPVLDLLYYAIDGQGSFKIEDHQRRKLEANNYSTSDSNLRVVCSRSHLNSDTQKFVNQLSKPLLITKGSSLKFLILAEGGAELYPRLAPTMEWDTAAAQIILTESGGKIFRTDGSPLLYNKENLLNHHFIATADEH